MEDSTREKQLEVVDRINNSERPRAWIAWGFLTPLRRSSSKKGAAYLRKRWKVRCVCGKEEIVPSYYLVRLPNPKIHCGCLAGSIMSRNKIEFNSWYMMHERCFNVTHKDHHHYGGRGITVCDRWNKNKLEPIEAFQNFLDDMGPRKTKRLTLDRIDNDGIYEPSNCRWATAKQQRANQRGT